MRHPRTWLGDEVTAWEQAEAALGLATEQEVTQLVALAMCNRGLRLLVQGQREEGRAQVQQGLDAY